MIEYLINVSYGFQKKYVYPKFVVHYKKYPKKISDKENPNTPIYNASKKKTQKPADSMEWLKLRNFNVNKPVSYSRYVSNTALQLQIFLILTTAGCKLEQIKPLLYNTEIVEERKDEYHMIIDTDDDDEKDILFWGFKPNEIC